MISHDQECSAAKPIDIDLWSRRDDRFADTIRRGRWARAVGHEGQRLHDATTPRTLESESFLIEMAERTQIQLQAVTHMFFSQAVPVQRSRSALLRLENARRS